MRINNTQTNYFYGDAVFQGGLSALSGAVFTNTIFTSTSALSVINTGIGPALYVAQAAGNYDIASFYDKDGIEVLHVGNAPIPGATGKIGINESNPGAELTVKGAISASGSLSATAVAGNWHVLAGSVAIGNETRATGTRSTAIGFFSSATAVGAIALGRYASASNSRSFVWHGRDTTTPFSSTRADQFAVSANGGVYLVGNVGINTDLNDQALTVVGNVSASGTMYASNKWVNSDPSLVPSSPAPSTITNIVTLSQAAYNALGSYSSTTLYIIV